jgi:hypothetical protein
MVVRMVFAFIAAARFAATALRGQRAAAMHLR